jgi:hypothetical protein
VRASTLNAPPPTYTMHGNASISQFTMIDDVSVVKLISDAPSKQCLLDPLPKWLLKVCVTEIAPFLTGIINRSLTNGVVPRAGLRRNWA